MKEIHLCTLIYKARAAKRKGSPWYNNIEGPDLTFAPKL